ncbi:hypothetical protein M9H77_13795 [Catharanthus roseus]|uniref:Uncharacterized protein n=1 Tax=Catharanthus roseus TaxID=4058 RepID=A0ACC0BLD0_CATRO|nr:hypothetical protein M9H77_13795 [Catharanthus roseus]
MLIDTVEAFQNENEKRVKKPKLAVGYHIVTMASIAIMWHEKHMVKEPSLDFRIARELYLRCLYYGTDIVGKEQLRLNRHAFTSLCRMLKDHGGLRDTINITVAVSLAIISFILGHNLKNHKDCLGALDGTFVLVNVLIKDQGRYHNRKNDIAINIMAFCSRDMKFTYILLGWERSAVDSTVLGDALVRSDPLVVPNGKFFLVDAGYTNGPDFLAPYRGVMINLEPSSDEREDEDEANDEELVDVNFTNFDNRIKIVRTTNGWTQFRDTLAQAVFAEYLNTQV